jgi:hypothetical protein
MTSKKIEENILLVFGDSHSVIWEGNNVRNRASKSKFSGVRSIHLGSALAYNLLDSNGDEYGKWGLRIIEEIYAQKSINSKLVAIMLCFGGIDIRTQVIKRASQSNIKIKDIVRMIVERLHKFAEKLYDLNQIPVIIWEPIPTVSSKTVEFTTLFPIVGAEAERNYATEQFSMISREICKLSQLADKKIYSFGIADKLMSFHETHPEYYEDGCHLNLKGLKLGVENLNKCAEEWGISQLSNFFSEYQDIQNFATLRNIASITSLSLSSEFITPSSISRQKDRGYCFHTKNDVNPRIIIDVGYAAIIKSVVLFNRFDGYFDRCKSLSIMVGVDLKRLYVLHECSGIWGSDGSPLIVQLPNGIGPIKYIVLTLQEQTFFHLGEVQIFEHSYIQ